MKENPEYLAWYRQDQIPIGSILWSCSESIQPLISLANTAWEAWEQLNSSYASTSGLMSSLWNPNSCKTLKDTDLLSTISKICNPFIMIFLLLNAPFLKKTSRCTFYLNSEVNIVTLLQPSKIHYTPLSYPKLFDKLLDFEKRLKETLQTTTSFVVTANSTTCHQIANPPTTSVPRTKSLHRTHNKKEPNPPQWSRSQRGGYNQNQNHNTSYYQLSTFQYILPRNGINYPEISKR